MVETPTSWKAILIPLGVWRSTVDFVPCDREERGANFLRMGLAHFRSLPLFRIAGAWSFCCVYKETQSQIYLCLSFTSYDEEAKQMIHAFFEDNFPINSIL
jgi:hypothetical protein